MNFGQVNTKTAIDNTYKNEADCVPIKLYA